MRSPALLAFSLVVFGCGAGAEPAKEPAPPSSEPAAPEPAAEPAAEPTADATADAAPSGDKPAESDEAASDQKGREVKYTQTPDGLKVEVAGVRFLATATPARAGGGWGVKVKVKASSTDGKEHKLLSPKNGPLAFAGKVDRGGNVEQLGDERAGDEEKVITEKGIEFTREWPGKAGKALAAGQSLELQVGIWGVGQNSTELRPVRQFCLVKMKAGNKTPQPVVTPPGTAVTEE
jgi:hypothetical protein